VKSFAQQTGGSIQTEHQIHIFYPGLGTPFANAVQEAENHHPLALFV